LAVLFVGPARREDGTHTRAAKDAPPGYGANVTNDRVVNPVAEDAAPPALDDRTLMADATVLVLTRLDARLAGDDAATRALDEAAAWDPRGLTALWSAAFGVALESLRALDRDQRAALLARLHREVDAWRAGDAAGKPREMPG